MSLFLVWKILYANLGLEVESGNHDRAWLPRQFRALPPSFIDNAWIHTRNAIIQLLTSNLAMVMDACYNMLCSTFSVML